MRTKCWSDRHWHLCRIKQTRFGIHCNRVMCRTWSGTEVHSNWPGCRLCISDEWVHFHWKRRQNPRPAIHLYRRWYKYQPKWTVGSYWCPGGPICHKSTYKQCHHWRRSKRRNSP
jgi:hypothetical protein